MTSNIIPVPFGQGAKINEAISKCLSMNQIADYLGCETYIASLVWRHWQRARA